MKSAIKKLIDGIDMMFMCIKINFEEASWRNDIPSEDGLYLIKTNTPIAELKSAGLPKHKAHIDIPKSAGNRS